MVWNAGKSLFGGRYIIESQLGEGGIGITYLARNQRNQQRVIKTLKEEILNHPAWILHRNKLRQDFRDEAVRLAVCHHPHIVEIETIFDDGNLPCMVMEYIEGEDLGQYLRRVGVLSEAEALLYIRQIGGALTLIHSKGLLHRDLKPRNIMIRINKPEAVLIDFGIAREFIPNVIQRHTVYRTPGFAPPEQYESEAPRGEYIDIYALAATLYNLLTAVIPTSADDRRHNINLEPPQYFNPNISNRVNQAIMCGMDLESTYRPQSVQEWLDLLGTDTGSNVTLGKSTLVITPKVKLSPPVVLDQQNWQCVQTLKGHSSMVHAIAISPDGQFIASGSNDHTIKLWQLGTGKLVRQMGRWSSGHSSMVHSIAFSPISAKLSYQGESGKSTGNTDSNWGILASGSWDNTIKLWDVNTGKEIRTLIGHTNWVNSVAFSPDGKFLASASADWKIKLWQVHTGIEIQSLTGHSDSVSSVAYSPKTPVTNSQDRQLVASGSNDYTIKLWQVYTGRNINTLLGHSFFVNCIAFSQDGEIIASGSGDNTIKLWHVNTGREIRTLTGHSDSVWSVAFSQDRQFLASGSWDNTIKLWHLHSGREISTLIGHSSYVRCVAFSPDGQTLVSGGDDDTIKIWRRG
ncbi:MAG: protein kinase domain-containing protein [Nostoc sp. DedVER02]|uniref:serine/threonine-protein kinase n=1 Tax=unclassified Nostoc TaxID=2593658 RepID=UPI002AD235AC|nr:MULTISPECIES: serine/threonine-protein kinase [unclassified Nostoc]MDZ7985206.1 serine/threonine-protein kinase [Nostoc sp. DedVER02]MDZ8115144.1 serine/threonine-protein kinase [Nostoc sp. DedVER01b]